MGHSKVLSGVTSLILGFFSIALTIIFVFNHPGSVTEFPLDTFRQQYSGIPPTLPFVAIGSIAALFSCRSGFGRPAIFVSLISILLLYMLYFY